jgi:protein-S-isoprenylcysteine O-methyltransferase Ste14
MKISNRFMNISLALLIAIEGIHGVFNAESIWDVMWWIIVTTAICYNIMSRLPPVQTDQRWWVWILCFASTFHFLAYDYTDDTKWSFWLLTALLLTGDLSLIYLGKNFSIIPALRIIKTGFLYHYLRHPIYALYIAGDIIYFTVNPTLWNGIITFISALLFAYRCRLEEKILSTDPQYQTYTLKTKWRMIPGVF